jgi:hypothetical protein
LHAAVKGTLSLVAQDVSASASQRRLCQQKLPDAHSLVVEAVAHWHAVVSARQLLRSHGETPDALAAVLVWFVVACSESSEKKEKSLRPWWPAQSPTKASLLICSGHASPPQGLPPN